MAIGFIYIYIYDHDRNSNIYPIVPLTNIILFEVLWGPCVTAFHIHKCFIFFNVGQTFNLLLASSAPSKRKCGSCEILWDMVPVGASVSTGECSPCLQPVQGILDVSGGVLISTAPQKRTWNPLLGAADGLEGLAQSLLGVSSSPIYPITEHLQHYNKLTEQHEL